MVMDDGNDPYREDDAVEMLDSPEDTGGGYTQNDPYRNARAQELAAATGKADALQQRQGAVGTLSAAEANASKNSGANGGLYKRETNLNDHKNPSAGGGFYKQGSDRDGSKNSAAGGFKNSVTGTNSTAGSIKKAATGGAVAKLSAAKDLLKNKGPFGVILAVVVVAGLAIFASQSLMPFSLVARFIEEYNGLSFSNENRYDTLLVRALRKTNSKAYNTATESLKKQGITVTEDGGRTTFSWVGSDGKAKSISGSGNDLKTALRNAMNTDADFRTKYQTAVSAWRGSGSGWFDSFTKSFLEGIGMSRSRYQNFDATEQDPEVREEQFKEMASNPNPEATDVDTVNRGEEEPDSGESDPDSPDAEDQEYNRKSVADDADMTSDVAVEAKVRDIADNIDTGAGILSTGVDVVCGTVSLYTTVSLLVYAHQVSELINLASGLLEAVDKVKAGHGDSSPIAEYMNALTRTDKNGKSAMSSSGISVLYSGAKGKNYTNSASVKLTNSENAFSNALGLSQLSGMTSADAFKNCAYARLGTSSAQAALGIMTLGGATIVGMVLDLFKSLATAVALDTVISAIVGYVTSIFKQDLIKNMVGEEVGDGFTRGAEEYISGNYRTSGGSPGSEAAVANYNQYKTEHLAQEAVYERETLSPFDVSSRYTFMGSIVDSIISFSTTSSNNAIFSAVTSIGSTLSNSVTSLLPSASAIATTNLDQTRGDCPLLESVGAVGDMYCNPYYIDDFSTMETDVNTVIRNVASLGGFEGYDGSITDDQIQQYIDGELDLEVKTGSNLYNYIVYCGGRESMYGVADGNIAAEISQPATGNEGIDALISGAGSIIDAAPIAGDIKGIIDAANEVSNTGWVGGGYCVASEENVAQSNWGGWEGEGKWYQRFTQDSRLMESMGFFDASSTAAIEVDQELAEKGIIAYDPDAPNDENGNVIADDQNESTSGLSAVSKAKLAYYEENPIDTSYLGQLSRYSGLSKDTIIAVLDEVDTYLARANYDPTGRGPATAAEVKTLNNKNLVATLTSKAPVNAPNMTAITPKYIAYQPVEQGTTA